MKVITVVRNFDMYNNLVKNNNYYPKDTDFICFDNTVENQTITKRYNSFIDAINTGLYGGDWCIFCHEDWELKEDIEELLNNIDKNCVYGVIGVEYNLKIIQKYKLEERIIGQIYNSHKDGSGCRLLGVYDDKMQEVGTVDCQCLIIHSSLITKYNLHFDENLSFDLYTEDFCISCRENFNIQTKILQIKCQHYSFGVLTKRFYDSFKYLQHKYNKSKNIYCSIACHNKIIGGNIKLKLLFLLNKVWFNFKKRIVKLKQVN